MWAAWTVMEMALTLQQAHYKILLCGELGGCVAASMRTARIPGVYSRRVRLVSCCAAKPCRMAHKPVVRVKGALQAEFRRAAAGPTRMPPRRPRTLCCCTWELCWPAPFCLLRLLLLLLLSRGGSVLAEPSRSAPISCQEAASYSVPRWPRPLVGTAGRTGSPQPTHLSFKAASTQDVDQLRQVGGYECAPTGAPQCQ